MAIWTHPEIFDAPPATSVGPAYIDAGFLVVGLSAAATQDVLNSLLLAQLVASRRADRTRDPEQWQTLFRETLALIGWLVRAGESVDYRPTGSFTIDQAALEVLSSAVPRAELTSVTAALASMRTLRLDDDRYDVFHDNTRGYQGANLAIVTAHERPGAIELRAATFVVRTRAGLESVLFSHLDPANATLQTSIDELVLKPEIYAGLRGAVNARLGNLPKKYIAALG